MQRETDAYNLLMSDRVFQSSPSMQRETANARSCLFNVYISILSLYAEGDSSVFFYIFLSFYFNPLPLCRGRPPMLSFVLSRLFISILSLYAEGDFQRYISVLVNLNFNPLPLCRGRPLAVVCRQQISQISILSLYAEGDS